MMAVDLDLSVFEEPAANSAGIGRRLGRAFAWVAPPAAAAAALAGMLLAVAFIPRSFPARVAALGGAATRADPHTLAAIEDAIAMNVDAVQLNVRLSGDGVPFVASDSLAGSAAGTDVLENVAYEKIRDISLPGVGSNPRIEYPPRLDEVLELARDKTWLILDLRAPAASLTRSNGLVERVIEVVQTARVASQVSLQSTNAAALSRARQLAPEIPVGSILPDSILDDDLPETAFMALPARDLRPADAHVARTRKLTLHAVMNDGNVSEDLDRLILSSQADVLVTAAPERALEALERARQLPPFRRALRRAHGWLIR
jgi:glycerophosphoryl diester phosphodiesterase